MSEINVGDLVQWETGDSARAGVVKKINDDGTSTVSRKDAGGSSEVIIRTDRLERIVSTVEAEDKS